VARAPTGSCRRVFASAHQRRGRKHRSGTSPDQVNAIATKPEQSRIRPATVTARKLLEANSSRMVHHLSLGNAGHSLDYRAPLLEQNDCPVAQSKGFPPRRSISTAGDVFMQHLLGGGVDASASQTGSAGKLKLQKCPISLVSAEGLESSTP
jgi:hypothetical protein